MKISCIGGGPAGLYFAILMKKADPSHDITVYERNRPYDTFGWGVVFSEETLRNLEGGDPESRQEIIDNFAHWDDIEVHYRGEVVRSGGHGFCGIERKHLLNILQHRAEGLGVKLVFETEIEDLSAFDDSDLILACDGVNSRIRTRFADHFKPDIEVRRNKFVWLGTHKLFDAFTFIFEETQWGWFQVHAYRFNDTTSTFIIETTEDAWRKAGLEGKTSTETIAFGERVFGKYLDGHSLMTNARHRVGSDWLNFPRVTCGTWVKDNIVLMGDAAHTAHYSIGSGTKLALEDAIALARKLSEMPEDLKGALAAYESERRVEVLKIQSAARNSTEWFENIARYASFEPEQFTYSLLTRSQRIGHENLRLRDPHWVATYQGWFAGNPDQGSAATATPPMFTPFTVAKMTVPNRVVVGPMAMYSATDGLPDDFHLVHYGSRAQGGAGLIVTEMTAVSAEGRATSGCPGLYTPSQEAAWARVASFVHKQSAAKLCVQLGHAGPKGACKPGWEGWDRPLDTGGWDLIGPSALPWSPANKVPRAADAADMQKVVSDFADAARRADRADFDMIELHAGHGQLLSAFLSPLSNRRDDEYGGSLENRLRFPLQVVRAVRAVWPLDKPLSVRISAVEWHQNGITPDDAITIAKMFRDNGADLIVVSGGETSVDAKPVYGRMYLTPLSDRIRNEASVPTMAVGNVSEYDHVNTIVSAGRADLVALARPHLSNPYFTLHAAAQQDFDRQPWPRPYGDGKSQMIALRKRQQTTSG